MDQRIIEKLAQYRALKLEIEAIVQGLFPVGSRVQPIGTTTGNWGATSGRIRGDEVWLVWDNGNLFFTPVDEIEHLPRSVEARQRGV